MANLNKAKIGRKNTNNQAPELELVEQEDKRSQYQKDMREPNYASYEDDPILNMEPIFVDDLNAQQLKFDNMTVASSNGDPNPLKAIIARHHAQNPASERKIAGPLGDIIGNARRKSEEIAHDVAERDPIIAKLNKIEELKRTGGTDSSLYTDVNKSQVGYYAKRAQEFHDQNVSKLPESDIERVKRLVRESQNREFKKYESNQTDRTQEIKDKVEAVRNRGNLDLEAISNVFKQRAAEFSQEVASSRTMHLQNSDNNIFSLKGQETFKAAKQMEAENLQTRKTALANEGIKMPKGEVTAEQIAAMEEKIKRKIERVQKHKTALAKKEAKVMQLLVETDAKQSSEKIAYLLDQRIMEIEHELQQLHAREKLLEETISYLKSIAPKKPRLGKMDSKSQKKVSEKNERTKG